MLGTVTAVETPKADPGHKFIPSKVLKREPISYPELAHLNRLEGVVRVKFSVDETGHVSNAIVNKSSGSLMLDEAVLDPRLRKWTFQPATLDGKPISSSMEQEFEFRLDPAEERAIALKRLALPVGTPNPPAPPESVAHSAQARVTIGVYWEKENGLVDNIYLVKPSGSRLLDEKALRFAYENWRTGPPISAEQFVKTVEFNGR